MVCNGIFWSGQLISTMYNGPQCLPRLRWEVPNFTVCGGQTNFFFFSLRGLTCAHSGKLFGPSLFKNGNLHFSSLDGGPTPNLSPKATIALLCHLTTKLCAVKWWSKEGNNRYVRLSSNVELFFSLQLST